MLHFRWKMKPLSIPLFVALSEGKSVSTFPENALILLCQEFVASITSPRVRGEVGRAFARPGEGASPLAKPPRCIPTTPLALDKTSLFQKRKIRLR